MPGFVFVHGNCISCRRYLSFNPNCVPSIRVDGSKEPLCPDCFNEWNEIHRTSKGLEPFKIHPRAYEPEPEENLR